MIVYITEEYLSILNEKKTASQYRKDKFKKTYDFKPDKNDKSGNTGTIKMNGRRVNVDLDSKATAASLTSKEPYISLSKSYWNLAGKYQKVTLDHEDGHNKLHNINTHNTYVDKKNKTPEVYKSTLKTMYKMGGTNMDNDKDIEKFKNQYDNLRYRGNDEVREIMYKTADGIRDVGIDGYTAKSTKDKKQESERNKSLFAAKKYETDKNHNNAIEYEADRYAANRNKNGEKAIIRGSKKYYKNEIRRAKKHTAYSQLLQNAKEQGKSNKQIKRMGRKGLEKFSMRDNNIAMADDLKSRTKALKDEELRNSKIYK